MESNWLLSRLLYVIPLVLSLTVHEWAHAFSAFRLGDDTAARQGRLTLNPVAHIDPIGTILLPLLGIPFGWARPVPVVPSRFRRSVNQSTGMMLTAIAGPLSNLFLALSCVIVLLACMRFSPQVLAEHEELAKLLEVGTGLNVSLAVFNALPIPPLDGSRVVDWLLPHNMRDAWESFGRYGQLVLLAVVFYGGSLLSWPMALAHAGVVRLAAMVVGL